MNKEVKTDPNRRRAASEGVKPQNLQSEDEKTSKPPPPTKEGNSTEKSSSKDDEGGSKNTEPKPQVHEKTDCECNGDHFPNVVMDNIYYGTLEKFDDLLFKSDFMSKFLVDNQKSTGKIYISKVSILLLNYLN